MRSNRGENGCRVHRAAKRALIPSLRHAVTVACLMLPAGCAEVQPRPDFERAVRMVTERTGIADVYDPGADAAVDEQVGALLADGLTVDEAVRVALLNNRGFQALFYALGASRADVVQSGLLSNPTLSLSVRFPEGGGRSSLTMGLGQELVDLWQIPVRKAMARSELEQTVQAVLHRAVELTADVRGACYRLLSLEKAEEIAHENLSLAERTIHLTDDRFRAGETGQLDVNLARSHAIEVRLALVTLERDRCAAEWALARELGLSRRVRSWKLADSLQAVPSETEDEAALLELAMDQRYDIRIAAERVYSAEAELLKQYRSLFPTLAVGVELERMEKRGAPGRKIVADTARESLAAGQLTAPALQSRGERRLEQSQIIDALLGPTLQLTLPIWDQNQAQIAKARYLLVQTRKDLEDVQDQVAQQVGEAVVAVRAAKELVGFYEGEALPLAEQNLEGARGLYQQGEESVLVLIEAQESLIQQRTAYVEALRDHAVAVAEIERAVGGHKVQRPAATATQPATTQPAAM